ncbi:hypothetical protein QBC39DRAFT_351480 [Podospora conica]|nr:hypothetical protein QBC39DRAFT_351480 [Schizothecium conicum]
MTPICRNNIARRAPTSPPQEWDRLRIRLTAMYLGERRSLPQIVDTLASEGFVASVKQFRDRFRKWGINTKNVKAHLKDHALAGIEGGVVHVSGPMVEVDGWAIATHKLRRHQAERGRGGRKAQGTRVHASLPMVTWADPSAGVQDASNEPVAHGQSPTESSSSRTLTAGGYDTSYDVEGPSSGATDTCGGSTRHPSSEASSPMGPRENPRGARTIAKNIWALRAFITLSSWFFDFLQMCRDPGLSPLHHEGWEDALKTQLDEYYALFLVGGSSTAQTARHAAEELRAVLDGSEEAATKVSRPEDINEAEFQTLHNICDVQYPDEIKLRFSSHEIQQELDVFEIELAETRECFMKFEADVEEEPRRQVERSARPFRRGEGSPVAFYYRLRDVVMFAFPIDIFVEEGLNFGQIRALNPGPQPMICFYESRVAATAAGNDPVMYDEGELEEYGVVTRQSHCCAEWA